MRVLLPVVVLLGLLSACAREMDSSGQNEIGPHGGALIALPREAGFVEIVLESPRPANEQVQVVAYFIDPSMEGTMEPLPTEVAIQVEFPDHAPASLRLSHQSNPVDRVGDGRFASKPGPYAVEPLQGTFSGILRGQPFSGQFKAPR